MMMIVVVVFEAVVEVVEQTAVGQGARQARGFGNNRCGRNHAREVHACHIQLKLEWWNNVEYLFGGGPKGRRGLAAACPWQRRGHARQSWRPCSTR